MSSTTPIDISNFVYDNKSFSLASYDLFPTGLAFNDDESKLWVIGQSSDTIYQYTLSTPGDISTATYDSKSFSVGSQETSPRDLAFNSDFSKVYVVGLINDTIYQYTLSTPGDISTATYDSKSFDVSAQENRPTSLAFNNDFSKVYVVGFANDTIYQYTLSTPGDISTASYDSNKSFLVSAQETSLTGLVFNNDFSKMWVIGTSSDTIYQYTLSTPGDISTATYDSKSFSVGSQEPNSLALAFNNDFSKVYVVGYGNNTIYQYSTGVILRISNSFTSKYSIRNPTSKSLTSRYNIKNLVIKSITSKFSIRKLVNNTKKTPGDISTAVYDSKSFSVNAQAETPTGLAFNNDQSKVWIVGVSSDTIYQYTLTTPGDISTAVYNNKSFSVGSQELQPTGLAFNNDFSKVWIVGASSDEIYQYTLSTPGDISTASYDYQGFVVDSQELQPRDLAFNNDQSKVWVVGLSNDRIYQYTLSIPGEIGTASYDSKSFSVASQEGNPTGLTFNDDQSKVWVIGINSDKIHQYTLSTPGDISTASYDGKSFSVSGQEPSPTGLAFNSDFSKVWIVGFNTDTIYQYSIAVIIDKFTSKYSIVGRVLKSVTSKFTIEDFIMRHFISRYRISNSVTKSVASKYNVIGRIEKQLTSKYQLVGRALKSVTSRYSIKNSVRRSITSRYAIAGKVAKSLTSKFSIRELITNAKKTIDVSTATYDNKSKPVGNEFTAPTGVTFNANRSRMWTVGKDNLFAYQYSLSTPGDVSTATYDNKKIGVSAGTQGISFNADYTKMYLVNSSLDTIIQYDLSTAEDISTATLVSSYSVSSQEDGPRGITVNRNVSKIWIVGSQRDTVYQYTLSTPGDVTSASYDSKSFNISNDAFPQGVAFNETETKMWVVGSSTDRVYQYTLGTAGDISTASYDGLSYSFNGLLTNPTDVKFNDDFTAMYVTGQHNNGVYQFAIPLSEIYAVSQYAIEVRVRSSILSQYRITNSITKTIPSQYSIQKTASNSILSQYQIFDTVRITNDILSSYSIRDTVSNSILSQYQLTDSITKSISSTYFVEERISNSITSQYRITNSITKTIPSQYSIQKTASNSILSQYEIKQIATNSISSHYKIEDIISNSFTSKYQIEKRVTNSIASIYTIEDKITKTITSNYSIKQIVTNTISSQYTIIERVEKILILQYSIRNVISKSISSQYVIEDITVKSITSNYSIKQKVSKQITSIYNIRNVVDAKLQTLTDAIYQNKSFEFNDQTVKPQGFTFNPDLSKMYVVFSGDDTVYQYSLSTPGDVSTITYDSKSFHVGGQASIPTDIKFNSDMSKMYIVDTTSDRIYQYALSTPGDVSTAVYSGGDTFHLIPYESTPQGVAFNSDLSKFYVVGLSSNQVQQATLSTPEDITTSNWDFKIFSVNSQETSPRAVTFNSDMSKMYVVGFTTDTVYQYTLSTPGDVTTASYDGIFLSISNQETKPTSVEFNGDMSQMYVAGLDSNKIFQYAIAQGSGGLTSQYSVRESIENSITSQYMIESAVTSSILSQYAIKERVANAIPSKYQIKKLIINSIQSEYTVVEKVSNAIPSVYDIEAHFKHSIPSQYTIQQRVTKSITSKYSIKIENINSIPSQYQIIQRVRKTYASSYYTIEGRTRTAIPSQYVVISRVTNSISSEYEIKITVTNQTPSQYQIIQRVRKTYASSYYTIEGRTKTAIPSQYKVLKTITNAIPSLYTIAQNATKTTTSLYTIVEKIINIITSRYEIKLPILNSISSQYKIIGAIRKTIPSLYIIIQNTTKTITSLYSILQIVTKRYASSYYTIEEKIVSSIGSRYSILQRITNSVNSIYNIITSITNSMPSRYAIASRVLNQILSKYSILERLINIAISEYTIKGRVEHDFRSRYFIGFIDLTPRYTFKFAPTTITMRLQP